MCVVWTYEVSPSGALSECKYTEMIAYGTLIEWCHDRYFERLRGGVGLAFGCFVYRRVIDINEFVILLC